MNAANDPAIQLSGVRKQFGETTAVRDLDLTVPRGAIYGLLGPNGAGKTTTIRMIMDILGPDTGTVRVLGRPIDDEIRSRIGYLPEERGLYQKMEVTEHIIFLGILHGLERGEARRRAERWLDRFGLSDRADEDVENLSKGMQQKVQFIGTILHDPELLILDEPFSGLDPINVDLLRRIVLERSRAGNTILFSTHMIEDAERLCGHVCMIAGARKVLDGSMAEVKAATGRRDVALRFTGDGAFLEDSPLIGRVSDHGGYVEIRLEDGADPQELLHRAIHSGARIERFELVEPSLREIFLEKAGERGLAPDETDGAGSRAARAAAAAASGGEQRARTGASTDPETGSR